MVDILLVKVNMFLQSEECGNIHIAMLRLFRRMLKSVSKILNYIHESMKTGLVVLPPCYRKEEPCE